MRRLWMHPPHRTPRLLAVPLTPPTCPLIGPRRPLRQLVSRARFHTARLMHGVLPRCLRYSIRPYFVQRCPAHHFSASPHPPSPGYPRRSPDSLRSPGFDPYGRWYSLRHLLYDVPSLGFLFLCSGSTFSALHMSSYLSLLSGHVRVTPHSFELQLVYSRFCRRRAPTALLFRAPSNPPLHRLTLVTSPPRPHFSSPHLVSVPLVVPVALRAPFLLRVRCPIPFLTRSVLDRPLPPWSRIHYLAALQCSSAGPPGSP